MVKECCEIIERRISIAKTPMVKRAMMGYKKKITHAEAEWAIVGKAPLGTRERRMKGGEGIIPCLTIYGPVDGYRWTVSRVCE
jgi:hypothetical protein